MEERHADLLPHTGAVTRVQRGGDGAGEAEPRHVVAHARALRRRRTLGLAERRHDAGARPEGGVVEGGPVLLRSRGAVARETRIDEARIPCPERLVVHTEGGELSPPQVRHEHVGAGGEALSERLPLGMPQVADDAALAAVVELEGRVDVGLERHEPRRGETAQRIAVGRLDLHHVRAPVGEDGGRRRHGHPDAELEDADAVERAAHRAGTCHGTAPLCKPGGAC